MMGWLTKRYLGVSTLTWALSFGAILLVSITRAASGTQDITSIDTFTAAIEAAMPILCAGLGGLWAERAGVVNIGLEGQMLLGTWGAAYFNYNFGAWAGLAGGLLLGALGGLLHAVATVTFKIDHIVSGVALNIIALGAIDFLSQAIFSKYQYGGPKQLDGLAALPTVHVPLLSGWMSSLSNQHIFLISDVAGFIGACVTALSLMTVIIAALVVVTAYVLWRTRFGLRLRSVGENPAAAESLGVNVYRYKYVAVIISGALAGMGGAFLCMVSSSGFVVNQTGGRGYIGLAAMIFGNWRPLPTAGAALLFGYTDALHLRSPDSVHALLLLVGLGLLLFAVVRFLKGARRAAFALAVAGAAFLAWFGLASTVPPEFSGMTPYIVTLLVLSLASQRLRPPAADGQPYQKGSVT